MDLTFETFFATFISPSMASNNGYKFVSTASWAILIVSLGWNLHPVAQGVRVWIYAGPSTPFALSSFFLKSSIYPTEAVAV